MIHNLGLFSEGPQNKASLLFHTGGLQLYSAASTCARHLILGLEHILSPLFPPRDRLCQASEEAFQQIMKYSYLGPHSSEETGPNRNFARHSHGSKASYMGRSVRQFLSMCSSVAMRHADP